MKWSRELRIARRSLKTAMRAATAMAAARARMPGAPASASDRTRADFLTIEDFGSNPGHLAMQVYLPAGGDRPHQPLIVLLHGCGQTAESFAHTAGWIALADQAGVPLVLPEQAERNNQGRCFNWFLPGQTARGGGEVLSIRQMVDAAVQRFASDPRRVFVAGLSAGGAMTVALLAAYPDAFAGGAVVAGLPVGAAGSVSEALRRMAEAGPVRSAAEWADQVRRIAPASYRGTWPRVSVWHGTADRVVDPANARLIAAQWAALHDLEHVEPETLELPGAQCERWPTAARPAVELWRVTGIGHDWPTGTTRSIARFWQIAD